MVECRTVNSDVPGSKPGGPAKGPVVQLVRTLPCHGRGRRFKSVMDRRARRGKGGFCVLRLTEKFPGIYRHMSVACSTILA